MLVLSRKASERVVIGDNEIIVTVVEIRGDKCRLGFTAPGTIPIYREEIFDLVKSKEAADGETPKDSCP